MHDIEDSYYKCNLTRGWCNLKIPIPGGIAALLITPGPIEMRLVFFGCTYVYSEEKHQLLVASLPIILMSFTCNYGCFQTTHEPQRLWQELIQLVCCAYTLYLELLIAVQQNQYIINNSHKLTTTRHKCSACSLINLSLCNKPPKF